ncbi:MAG TPA: calcium/sodium antiporter [Polyangiaceae bacterium]
MNALLHLLGGGLLLYFGAQWLVAGSSALALALRIPPLIVGLTVVAYGTSTPEVIVSVQAALAGHPAVAIGNVVGSNIANIGLVLGISAIIAPARVNGALRSREMPVLLGSTVLIVGMLVDGAISRIEAAGLLACGVLYTAWMIRAARAEAEVRAATADTIVERDAADAAGAPQARGVARSALIASCGLGVLLVGGSLFVDGAVAAAYAFGMSERLVGVTVVAVGTSLPELVTSVVAARRGHSDLAVGNVIGSSIFNASLCLGGAGLVGNVGADVRELAVDLVGLGVMTAVAAVFIRSDRTISRQEGALAVALYVVFVAATIAPG